MKENQEIFESKSQLNTVIDYCANKYCPLFLVGLLLFTSFSVDDWRMYVIGGLVLYIQHFNWKVGYSVGVCEKHGLIPEED